MPPKKLAIVNIHLTMASDGGGNVYIKNLQRNLIIAESSLGAEAAGVCDGHAGSEAEVFHVVDVVVDGDFGGAVFHAFAHAVHGESGVAPFVEFAREVDGLEGFAEAFELEDVFFAEAVDGGGESFAMPGCGEDGSDEVFEVAAEGFADHAEELGVAHAVRGSVFGEFGEVFWGEFFFAPAVLVFAARPVEPVLVEVLWAHVVEFAGATARVVEHEEHDAFAAGVLQGVDDLFDLGEGDRAALCLVIVFKGWGHEGVVPPGMLSARRDKAVIRMMTLYSSELLVLARSGCAGCGRKRKDGLGRTQAANKGKTRGVPG